MEKIDTDWKAKRLKSLAKLFKPFSRDWAPLNYNFECDKLIELSGNKLSNNKLSNNKLSEIVEKDFFKPITIEEIAIFLWLT